MCSNQFLCGSKRSKIMQSRKKIAWECLCNKVCCNWDNHSEWTSLKAKDLDLCILLRPQAHTIDHSVDVRMGLLHEWGMISAREALFHLRKFLNSSSLRASAANSPMTGSMPAWSSREDFWDTLLRWGSGALWRTCIISQENSFVASGVLDILATSKCSYLGLQREVYIPLFWSSEKSQALTLFLDWIFPLLTSWPTPENQCSTSFSQENLFKYPWTVRLFQF